MDRRKFLSAVSLLGSGRVFASSAEEHPPEYLHSMEPASTFRQSEMAEAVSPDTERVPKVGIIAIGSAGGWVLGCLNGKLPRLYRSVAVDTNPFLLHRTNADTRILVGGRASINVGAALAGAQAEAVADEITGAIEDLDQLLILTDMGGAIEKELASVVAKIAHDAKVMAIGAVITSSHQGATGARQVEHDGINNLAQRGMPTIFLSRSRYSRTGISGGIATQVEAATAFERLYRSIVIIQEGDGQSLIWLDREAVQAAFSPNDHCIMAIGYGSARGYDSSQLAARRAIAHPLFEADRGAPSVALLISIEARPEILKMREVNRILNIVREEFPDHLLIFGAFRNPKLDDDFHVTVVAPAAQLTQYSG